MAYKAVPGKAARPDGPTHKERLDARLERMAADSAEFMAAFKSADERAAEDKAAGKPAKTK